MRIKKIQLMNGYKRFFDLTIDLGEEPKRIIALIGPNGCGKSSVLDGMLYFTNMFNTIGSTGAKDHKYHSMNNEKNYSYNNIKIEFVEGAYEVISSHKAIKEKEKTIFSFRSSYRYNTGLNVQSSHAIRNITENHYGASTASDLDSKIDENYRRLYVKFNDYMYKTDCPPSQAKEKIIGDLNKSFRNCLDLELISIGDINASKGTLYFRKLDHANSFEFNVLSSGEKEVVDILLDLYLRQEEYDDTIFLFDEPELHINTAIQKKLIIEINCLIGINCQLWLTTHSIGFLRALQDEFKDECQIIQFKNDMNLASEAKILKPIQHSIAVWKELFEVALDDLAHLVCPKRIIYCEGKDTPGKNFKENGFDARVYNVIFAEKYPDSLFISSGGNTELDQRSNIAISIIGKALPLLEILVLKDKDCASGKQVSVSDRDRILEFSPAHHRILKRFEIENYLFDKEVINNYCSINSISFDESEYEKLIKNINEDDVKSKVNNIKKICAIPSTIPNDTFKFNLASYITKDTAVFKELEELIFKSVR
ncbi:AAA family ATPase [Nitrosomonas supralitoralis]|uniref:ATPase AAA-type core domain-containing protein n=1 Tax=Nitrosomonas supralitoralis TaxID=2116706 RepID=A0A2P7NR70_9PROT|nr:AAA family ATPase [Nitrosomonas supralitoralis]PSJ15950.1 hypothetical protein C7H79_16225 [Nitrosomonas supralitoralis]